MRFELTPRPNVSPVMRAVAPVAAFITAFLIAGFVIWLMGRSPIAAFDVYVLQPLSDPWSLQELVVKATPLALIAIGLSYCFRANLWNIGAEGQYVIGAVLGSWLALKTHGTEAGFWVLPLMLLLGVIGGALYGLIPAFLKTRFGVNEILTSLMLVYVAQLVLDYLVRGPWRDPKGFNFPQSVTFDPSATLHPIFEGGRVHFGAMFALIAVLATAVILGRTLFGYRLKLTGDAPRDLPASAPSRPRWLCSRSQADSPGLRASRRFPVRSASCSRRFLRAMASRPSPWRFSAGSTPSASWSRPWLWRSPSSAARARRFC